MTGVQTCALPICRVERGVLHVGDEIEIVGIKPTQKTTCTGIEMFRKLLDHGQAVHDHAYANGYTVVREIGGHGVGLEFHEDPSPAGTTGRTCCC